MPEKPIDQDDQRTPEEATRLARDVMKRMLQTPPKPHDEMMMKKPAKRKSRRK